MLALTSLKIRVTKQKKLFGQSCLKSLSLSLVDSWSMSYVCYLQVNQSSRSVRNAALIFMSQISIFALQTLVVTSWSPLSLQNVACQSMSVDVCANSCSQCDVKCVNICKLLYTCSYMCSVNAEIQQYYNHRSLLSMVHSRLPLLTLILVKTLISVLLGVKKSMSSHSRVRPLFLVHPLYSLDPPT